MDRTSAGEPGPDSTRSELSGSAREVVQARDVHGGVHFHGPHGEPWMVPPRQLPADVRGFVNRVTELGWLTRSLVDRPGDAGLLVIAGTAGVGKTSLAVHWAHRIEDSFPDGQLYLNMRGYDPGPPVEAEQALDHLLRALHVPAGAIPPTLDAKSSLFRSLLAGKRVLLLLDNVATAAQAGPLLPGASGCLTIVTSRSRLSGLAVRYGAHRVTIDVLTEDEAVTLLRTVTAAYRDGDDDADLVELARLCARLPLALRIAAERAARRPGVPLADLIQDLRNESGLWDALSADDGEEAGAVRTVFAWSYRALPAETAQFFRLLGLHPGPGFSTAAAGALTASTTGHARRQLDLLVGAHLVEQTGRDRYQFHDLLRAYATDQARQEEPPDQRAAALERVVTWYLHGAAALQRALSPQSPRSGPLPETAEPPRIGTAAEAAGWFATEGDNLVGATRAAAETGMDHLACALAVTLHHVYRNLSSFDAWTATTEAGLVSAERLGDRAREADLLESLATVRYLRYDYAGAASVYESALAIRAELGDRLGEAFVLNGLGLLSLRLRDLPAALRHFDAFLRMVAEEGHAYWQAVATGNLGAVRFAMGDLDAARELLARTLDAHLAEGDRLGEGDALHSLAQVDREAGRLDQASEEIARAVAIAVEDGNTVWEGYWLIEQGRVQRATGSPAEALASLQRAAALQRLNGDRGREAQALDETGAAYRDLGRPEEAADFHRLALATHRDLGDRWLTAVTLDHLALATDDLGDTAEAARHRRAALAESADFTDPRALAFRERVRAALAGG